MTEQHEQARHPSGNNLLAYACLLLFIGGVALGLTMRWAQESVASMPGAAFGLGIALVGILLAPLTSVLASVVRHLYMVHYAAIAGLCSVSLLLPMASLLESSILKDLAATGIVCAGPVVVAHLAACASGHLKHSGTVGFIGGLITFISVKPGLGLSAFAITSVLIPAWYSVHDAGDKRPIPHLKSWNFASFVLFNLIVLLGLGTVLALYFYFVWGAATDLDSPVLPEPREAFAWAHEGALPVWGAAIARWVGGLLGLIAGAASVLLWPARRLTPLHGAAGVGCVAVAALMGGQTTLGTVLVAAGTGAVLILFGGSLLAVGPRRSRWPCAIIGAAAGATILLQCATPLPPHPVYGLAIWLVEAVLLAGIWIGAYFGGIAVLRRREENAGS